MKIFKYKAFTLSELMVLMAILTILFAAFAPVFTVRYNNASSDYVWSFVQDDTNGNAYTDELNKTLLAQSFIGISPTRPSDVFSRYAPYSKLIIRGSSLLSIPQAQIDFRYGDNDSGNGSLVSSLFAGNGNFMIGGPFRSITSYASDNTAFGVSSLKNITSGYRNTAVGYQALYELTTGSDNTSIGMNAGNAIKTGSQNTTIGYHSGQSVSGSSNTLIGNYVMSGSSGSNNTYVGSNVAQRHSGDNNTALGAMAMYNSAFKSGHYNTAVGAYTLRNNNGNYNTAIGYNACSAVTGSYKTCIGKDSGAMSASEYDAHAVFNGGVGTSSILSDDTERIFIGSIPKTNYTDGNAVLEVHNVNGTHNGIGNSSVVINGNLIIRGQTFMRANLGNHGMTGGHGLASFHISHPKDGTWAHLVGGYTGSHESENLIGACKRPIHEKINGFGACICAASDGSDNGIVSYDWATSGTGNVYAKYNFTIGGGYTDQSTGRWISKGYGRPDDDVVVDYAHAFNGENTCCPYLKSDVRLKNIGTEFAGGLKEINKLKVYNYTYKKDKLKLPHVGVIAQDLKRIFPTAVTKAADGYYKIRWDEIFYSAINAVKELNSKIDTLALRIKNDIERVSVLKKDNAQLKKQLDILSQELSALEK